MIRLDGAMRLVRVGMESVEMSADVFDRTKILTGFHER
jgi:hypothetical protein